MDKRIQFITGNIFNLSADAMVFPAYRLPDVGGGLDCQVYNRAGYEKLLDERKQKGQISFGNVCVTNSYDIDNYRYLIHAVSPQKNNSDECISKLEACYANAMLEAERYDCQTIVFSVLGSGVQGFEQEHAKKIAKKAINEYFGTHSESKINLVTIVEYENNDVYDDYVKLMNAFKKFEQHGKSGKDLFNSSNDSIVIHRMMTFFFDISNDLLEHYYMIALNARNEYESNYIKYKDNTENGQRTRNDYNICEYTKIVRSAMKDKKLTPEILSETLSSNDVSTVRKILYPIGKNTDLEQAGLSETIQDRATGFLSKSENVIKLGLALFLEIKDFCKLTWSQGYAFPVTTFHFEILNYINQNKHKEALDIFFPSTKEFKKQKTV